jgi:hypothetical protein
MKPHNCDLCSCDSCCNACVVIAEYPVDDDEICQITDNLCKALKAGETSH